MPYTFQGCDRWNKKIIFDNDDFFFISIQNKIRFNLLEHPLGTVKTFCTLDILYFAHKGFFYILTLKKDLS